MPENDGLIQDAQILIGDAEAELERLRREGEEARLKLEALREQYREVRARREALAKHVADEQAKKKREEELNRETEIRACDFNGFFVNVKILPDIRTDILDILRSIYGRQFDVYSGVNRVPVEAWTTFKNAASVLPHVKITHLLGVMEKIKKYLEQPDFQVALENKVLKVVTHAQAPGRYINNIPGAEFFRDKGYWTVPLTEGWRLFQNLESYDAEVEKKRGVVWQPEALALVESEIERRTTLDTVATQEDAEIDVSLTNGHILRPFQRVGIKFVDLTKGRTLIADQMGLGKTWQALGYCEMHKYRAIIVCPAHLKANWSREIYSLTGVLPVILSGREPDKYDVEALLLNKPRYVIINYDILSTKIMTEEEVTFDEKGFKHTKPPRPRWLWVELINMAKFDVCIADEIHYAKNTDSNRSMATRLINTTHRLGLTGTPVLNRPGEYWAALTWLRPELFPSEEKFINQYTYNGKTARNVGELREILKPIMIRRLKKDIIKELPPINRITQLHELTPEAQVKYKKVLEGVYKAIDDAGNEVQRNITSILVEIGKLKEVCAEDKVEATANLASELYDTEQDAADAKLGNKKVLIFSQYKAPVRQIAMRLGREAIYWTGDTDFDERTRLENEFQTNPNVHFLVVSLMTGQTGLNLTAAGHIIFNDLYWTPASHAQAEERAYGRLSNMHGADSYYMVASNTIEDWIQELLAAKLATINAVVEGIESERDPAIGMEIIARLKAMRGML